MNMILLPDNTPQHIFDHHYSLNIKCFIFHKKISQKRVATLIITLLGRSRNL